MSQLEVESALQQSVCFVAEVLDQMAASCGIIATQDLGHWPTTFTLLFNKRTTHEPEVDPVIPVFASASEILRADSISENNWIRDMNQRCDA